MRKLADPAKARLLQGFFKTGKGEYGEGDIFLGIVVPKQRKVAMKYRELPLEDIQTLLKSNIHEERFVALTILVSKFSDSDQKGKEKISKFYLRNAERINNWDLVDTSAPRIVGEFLMDKDKAMLYTLAKSDNLWRRRIAILSTLYFIKNGSLDDTFRISELLLNDEHDLIHKAVGWMLREAGKMDQPSLEKFLKRHYKSMPRTMLRYAIEKFPEKRRKAYLNGLI
jgi:3-methyladenine DNA glycosylase AlkD